MPSIGNISELKEINGQAAQRWVRRQNKITHRALDKTATFRKLFKECESLNKNDHSDNIIWDADNFYQRLYTDKTHSKGLLQQTTKESFFSDQPEWETLLDIDAFATAEKKEWEFNNIDCIKQNKKIYSIITFSEAGSDAHIVREFDIKNKKFVENGFALSKAHSDITWYSPDYLIVATECGEHSLTKANYPRTIRLLKRGQSLQDAPLLFESEVSHMNVYCEHWNYRSKTYLFYIDIIDFYHQKFYLADLKNLAHSHPLPVPLDAELMWIFQHTALIKLSTDWQISDDAFFKANSLIGLDLRKFRKNPQAKPEELNLTLWYEADQHSKIEHIFCDDDNVCLFVINNLQTEMLHLIPSSRNVRSKKISLPLDYCAVTPLFVDKDNEMLFYIESFTQAKSLYAYHPESSELKLLKKGNDYFDPAHYFVRRLETRSKDGTTVPYYIVGKKGLKQDGLNPTILNGYGGFGEFLEPNYLKYKAIALLDKGFIYVHAHIRGGGEFGPQWHKMGIHQYKQNSFDDFIAVAEDLITQNITCTQHLGIFGASNGGLLVAACMTQRPELFGAVFLDVAPFDMLQYHKLFVGSAWLAEYGNPDDPDERKFLEKYSPLHTIAAEKQYPKIFIQSSKTDDRLHPYHGRAMTHLLQQFKKSAFYFEKKDGGHEGSSFEEFIRIFTYWNLQLLIPAQRERKRQREETNETTAGFFKVSERHMPHRRLAKEHTHAAKTGPSR